MAAVIGRGERRVSISSETEREADNRATDRRRRIIVFDEDGETIFLSLDAEERNRLRDVLDEIGPDDWQKRSSF